jgi:hypothetical protein
MRLLGDAEVKHTGHFFLWERASVMHLHENANQLHGTYIYKTRNARSTEDMTTHGDSAGYGETSAHRAHQTCSLVRLPIGVNFKVVLMAALYKPCRPANIDLTGFSDLARGQQRVFT